MKRGTKKSKRPAIDPGIVSPIAIPPADARYWQRHLLAPTLAAALLLVLFESTSLDRWVQDFFYDPATRSFPKREDRIWQTFLHHGTKYAVIAFAAFALWALILTFHRPKYAPWRRTLVYVLLCLGLAPLIVATLKHASYKHCPYDLDIYGGFAPYTRLLEPAALGIKQGGCFPGGHASGGFALMAMYFALRIHAPSRARWALYIGFAYGFATGFVRVIQGAHFVSHNLATAYIVWLVCFLVYELLLRRADERRFGAPPTATATSGSGSRRATSTLE